MNTSTAARLGIAGLVAGAGLAVGGVALASADTPSTGSTTSTSARPAGPHGGPDAQAAVIAEKLGLKQSVVEKALQAVRDDLRPATPQDGEKPTPPSDSERAAQQEKLAAALAQELGVSQSKVEAALSAAEKQAEADRTEHRTQERSDLADRLDAAVKKGTISSSDKALVLKAFDADLLGPAGGPGGPGKGGPGAGGPGEGGPAAPAAQDDATS